MAKYVRRNGLSARINMATVFDPQTGEFRDDRTGQPVANPYSPWVGMNESLKVAAQNRPVNMQVQNTPQGVSMTNAPEDLINQLNAEQMQRLAEQRSGVAAQREMLATQLEKYQPQTDISPIASLVDAWTGSRFAQNIPQQKGNLADLLEAENKLQQRQEGLTRTQQDLLEANLKTKLQEQSAKDRARLQQMLFGERAQTRTEEKAQDIRKDILKSEPAKQNEALIKLQKSINDYGAAVDKAGGFAFSGKDAAEIQSKLADLQIQYKEAANLGALTGPDVELIKRAITPGSGGPADFVRFKLRGGLPGAKENIESALGQLKGKIQANTEALKAAFPVKAAETQLQRYEEAPQKIELKEKAKQKLEDKLLEEKMGL